MGKRKTKLGLLTQIQTLKTALGENYQDSVLPLGRMPTEEDKLQDFEDAVTALQAAVKTQNDPVGVITEALTEVRQNKLADPAETESEDLGRRQRLYNKALACWSALMRRARDQLPQNLRINEGRMRRLLDGLSRTNLQELEEMAVNLKQLADVYAPQPSEKVLHVICAGLRNLGEEATFPADLKETLERILAVKEPTDRWRVLLRLEPETAEKIADFLTVKVGAEALATAAAAVPTRPVRQTNEQPTPPVAVAALEAPPAPAPIAGTRQLPTFPIDPEIPEGDSTVNVNTAVKANASTLTKEECDRLTETLAKRDQELAGIRQELADAKKAKEDADLAHEEELAHERQVLKNALEKVGSITDLWNNLQESHVALTQQADTLQRQLQSRPTWGTVITTVVIVGVLAGLLSVVGAIASSARMPAATQQAAPTDAANKPRIRLKSTDPYATEAAGKQG